MGRLAQCYPRFDLTGTWRSPAERHGLGFSMMSPIIQRARLLVRAEGQLVDDRGQRRTRGPLHRLKHMLIEDGSGGPGRVPNTGHVKPGRVWGFQRVLSQHLLPGGSALSSVAKRIADRVMSVARPSLATLVNVFMVRCEMCGLLKVDRRLDQSPSECPLCGASIAVLAHYRSNSPTCSSAVVSDDRDRGTARGTRVTTASVEAKT